MPRFIYLILLCLLLTACTNANKVNSSKPQNPSIEQTNKQTNEQKSEEKDLYSFDLSTGGVFTSDNFTMIYGKTNLLEGTILDLSFDSSKMKPAKVKVDEDGRFSITLDQTIKTDTKMRVVMKPDQQPEELQKEYGVEGKKLTKSYQYKYKSNGKVIIGLAINAVMWGINPDEGIAEGMQLFNPGYDTEEN